jgi:hypothetical protein
MKKTIIHHSKRVYNTFGHFKNRTINVKAFFIRYSFLLSSTHQLPLDYVYIFMHVIIKFDIIIIVYQEEQPHLLIQTPPYNGMAYVRRIPASLQPWNKS